MALEDIRVLDMTRLVPGPFCTMFLADLGAEVIQVEQPGTDISQERLAIPFPLPPDVSMEKIMAYNPLKRNKKSICLNLKSVEGRAIFNKLAERADVVIEGFRPGVVKRLGVDYESLSKLNPRLVYCSLTGYGQSGPYHSLPSHDINYIAIAGALGLIGDNGKPVIPLNLLGDYGGGLVAAVGILAALLARNKTDKGQYVDISMTDSVAVLLVTYICGHLLTGIIPKPGEVHRYGGDPFYNVYETKDGKYISLGCREPQFIRNLCRALGREDLATAGETSEEKLMEAFSYFREVFMTKTRDEWFDLLSQQNVSVSKVNSLDEVLTDPQLLHREMVVEVDYPETGSLKQIGIPIKLSETPGSIQRLGAVPGQHTDEILLGLGYTEETITALRQKGAIA